jgi:excisionase family DNA binding protein
VTRNDAGSPDPADAIRTAAERIKSAERELVDARAALAAAETQLAAARLPRLAPDAYTMEQVGELLGLSRSTVALMIRDGTIKSVKLGGARRVFRADLDTYIASARERAS